MFDSSRYDPLQIARNTIAKAVRELDADALDAPRAVELVDYFAGLKNLAAAGEAVAAAAVARTTAWYGSGERSPAEWLAKRTGTSTGTARGALETAEKLTGAPATDEAFRNGALSAQQAEAIAGAAAANPGAEQELLGMAKTQPLAKLKDRCAQVKAAAEADPEEKHRRIHHNRFFRSWTDAEGARRGMYAMTPENAAVIEAAVKPFADAAFEAARVAGECESSEAYAADGVVAMARGASGAGGCSSSRRDNRMVALVNLETLRRGSVEPDEVCEIPGVGPISATAARQLFGDALLSIVIRDGVDIRTVVHCGRSANAAQRTAIFVMQRGRCLRPTCERRIAEYDHTDDWVRTRHTTLDELGGLCAHDHRLKTHHGHRYRRGARGWEWHRPDGVVEYERPPP